MMARRGLARRVEQGVVERTSRRQSQLAATQGFLIAGVGGAILGKMVELIYNAGAVYVAIGIVSLVLLSIVIIALRRRLGATRGTLFYVPVLHQKMVDLQEDNFNILRNEYSASWRTPGISNPREKVGMVDDFTSAVAEARGRLIERMDQDARTTGCHVAPNMLWATALSLGFDLRWPSGTEFIELPTGLKIDKKGRQPGDLVAWNIHEEPPEAPGLALPICRTIPGSADARAVLVTAELTDAGPATPQPYNVIATYHVAVFEAINSGEPLPVEVDTEPSFAARRRAQRAVESNVAVVHPEAAARSCLKAIRLALHNHPEALVLLLLRVPKAVGLRLGDLLQADGKSPGDPGCGKLGCANESCNEPWSRLVPLLYQHPSGVYRAARVHDSQPTASELNESLGGLR